MHDVAEHGQRPWGDLPAPALAAVAQRLPAGNGAIAAARAVCRHWHACCTASVQQLTLKVQPHLELLHGTTGPFSLPQPAPQQLLAAALVLPYHARSTSEATHAVPAAAARLLCELAQSCPRLLSLDLGCWRHLHYEPMLRKACFTPVLASQLSLLSTLVSLHSPGDSSGATAFQGGSTCAESAGGGGTDVARPAARCLQLQHLTLLYCTHSVAKAAKRWGAGVFTGGEGTEMREEGVI